MTHYVNNCYLYRTISVFCGVHKTLHDCARIVRPNYNDVTTSFHAATPDWTNTDTFQ